MVTKLCGVCRTPSEGMTAMFAGEPVCDDCKDELEADGYEVVETCS